ncbi:MAG: prohibitin family protein [Methylococcales bacterium]|nr:prohibitin family protein [Methylococcales bacterium]
MKKILLYWKKISRFFIQAIYSFRIWLRKVIGYLIVIVLLASLSFAFFWPSIIITIHSGEAGVLYRWFFGTVTDKVYPEGVHTIYPWDTLHIYNVRIQNVMHDFEILTNQGLPITIRLAIRFRPEYEMLGILHQQVGPNYVETIIIPQVESVLRKRLSLYNPEDIYINKNSILTKVINEALEELGQKYITTDGIIIRSITLPEAIRKAIEDKLVEEQIEKKYIFTLKKETQEAERKRIEAEGIKDYNRIILETLDEKIILMKGVDATLNLAKSPNSKVVVIGSGKNGLPIILGGDNAATSLTPLKKVHPRPVKKKTQKIKKDVKN